MTRVAVAFAIALLAMGVANARSEDGTLGFIQVPNNGQPAIVVRGETFTIRAQGEPDIFVDTHAGLIELTVDWRRIPGRDAETLVRVPAEFAPGLYNIVGNLDEAEDTQQRALLVLENAPKQYYIAHIPSPGIEAAQEASLAGALPGESALFAIVTGDLTANGNADEFRTLLDWLNTSPIATIVAPGKRDSTEGRFGDYFDTAPRTVQCGRDAFLTIGETVPHLGEDVSGAAGIYQTLRRSMKPARWSTGISGYAHATLSPRMQIVLFVDTPLHVLVGGRAESVTAEQATVAWDSFQGPTRIIAPVLDQPVGIQWIHVTPAGIVESNSPGEDEP